MRKSGGFTLLEIMLVIVVIGLLAAFAIPNYASSIERARCSFAMNMLKSMRNAAILYFRENQTFTGMTHGALETLAGADLYAVTAHPDWQFAVGGVGANTFILTATRLKGPHSGDSIVVSSTGSLLGSSYPHENPGAF